MGLQTLKCFIDGDVAKHQQTEKETSFRPWQAMASAHHATLFFPSFFFSSNCHDTAEHTVSKGGTFNRILILTDALDAHYTAEYS